MDPLKRVLTREVKRKCLKNMKKTFFSVIKVSRIDLQEGELYAQHYDQRKELGRC